MKYALLTLSILVSGVAQAANNEFTLHYRFMDKHLVEKVSTKTFDEAIEVGSQKCLKYFFSQYRVSQLNEDQKLGLANTCTNPRKS